MFSSEPKIKLNDTVICYASPLNMFPLVVEANKTYRCKYGSYKLDDFVGKSFGSKMPSTDSKGFLHLLRPTPALWTLSLPHRTQIIYSADISLLTSLLELRPGSKVAEAGTGSGSFSHSILNTIGPEGHLYTFEYHAERVEKAKLEFNQHGFSDRVTVSHRDVCKDGLDLDDCVDAVFLDLPSPWEAIAAAKLAIKNSGGRIATFSPCIEQVTRTVQELEKQGAVQIRMFEVLTKSFELKQMPKLDITAGDYAMSRKSAGKRKRKAEDEDETIEDQKSSLMVTKPSFEMKGHTSFLLFAQWNSV